MFEEIDFIQELKSRFPPGPHVSVGIGDDGAVLHPAGQQVVVTDMLLDGRHFEIQSCSPELAGRKSVAVNLSDLAAMGCRPVAAFISVALSSGVQTPQRFLQRFYDGIEQLARHYHFTIAGGDTTSWDGPFAVNVCLTGTPFSNAPVLRSGARSGDRLYVTGPLGGSLLSGRHLTFDPRLRESEWLSGSGVVSAMMDISDGLSLDLHRLCRASEVGAEIIAEQVPVSSDVETTLSANERLSRAFGDGEDFELLFAVAPDSEAALRNAPFDLYQIGTVTAETELILSQNGAPQQLPVSGWQSF